MLKAVKVRLYPTDEQEVAVSKLFGCARWYWNYALNACIQHYKQTGKSLPLKAYKGILPQLKAEHPWLKEDCYSQVLQSVALNLDKAYKNFFEGRAKFPKFKSKHQKQSIQYPPNVSRVGGGLKIPKIGEIKAVFHRPIEGTIKTVTINKNVSGKYFAAILFEVEGSAKSSRNKTLGIDLGLKDFAIVHDGEQVAKYSNPRHLKRHEKNLARKQKKLVCKQKGSKSRDKYKKLVAKVYERVSNTRQDFLHKLSRKLVDESQVIVVENINVKGSAIRNRKLTKFISDVGWETFVNFLDYKLKQQDGQLVEIGRFFPSSKTCSHCSHVVNELPLDIREWSCPHCGAHHDRDANAALNIRTEGLQILAIGGGNPVTAALKLRKTNKPKGKKAAADETRSPCLTCTQVAVG